MATPTDVRIQSLAESCVGSMGDIFWDFDAARDAEGDYSDPYHVAVEAVKATIWESTVHFETNTTYTASLRAEYAALVDALPDSPSDRQLIRALMSDADWTDRGATELVQLSRRYGTFVLRNALALAEAMKIEDGSAGL